MSPHTQALTEVQMPESDRKRMQEKGDQNAESSFSRGGGECAHPRGLYSLTQQLRLISAAVRNFLRV